MAVSAHDVKRLREKTGLGVMDCKRALQEAGGEEAKAIEILRKQGVKVAESKRSRTATEGVIASYVHVNNRVGAMVELACETDFVARTEEFGSFAKEVAMQIAAQQPTWVTPEDVPEEALTREREILTEQALAEGKPDHIVAKMVEGRLKKFYEQHCLMNQPYIRDDSTTIADLLNELVAKMGEKLLVRRFVRYQVGEELD